MTTNSTTPLNLDKFKSILEIVQLIAVITAILIGGGWTLYTFISLEAVNKAKIELEEMKHKLIRRAVLDINLVAENETKKDQAEYYISATVTVANKGTREAHLDFSEHPFLTPLSISKVTFDKKGGPEFVNSQTYKINMAISEIIDVVLLPNENISLPFYVKVKEAGVYFLEFSVPQKGIERKEHEKIINNELFGDTIWTKGIFLKVY